MQRSILMQQSHQAGAERFAGDAVDAVALCDAMARALVVLVDLIGVVWKAGAERLAGDAENFAASVPGCAT